MFILFIDDFSDGRDTTLLTSCFTSIFQPARSTSFRQPVAAIKQLLRAPSSSDAVKCQPERRVFDTSLHISLTWDTSCQKSKKSKDKRHQRPAKEREMRTFQSQSQRGAFSTLHSLSSSAMSPLRTASITFAALLILTIPVCQSKSAYFLISRFIPNLKS